MAKTASRRVGLLAVLVVLVALASAPARALAAGGTSIASAPAVVYGQQEFGNTATDQHLEGSCGFSGDAWRSYWTLNVVAGDRLTIDWESSAPKTEIELMPIGTTDFTFLKTEPAASQSLSSNGKNQLQYTAPQSGAMPLYFQACGFENAGGPYDFTATDQHALVVGLQQYAHIKTTSTLWGKASLADGTPVPDGLVFTLSASWGDHGQAQYQATSSGGALGFPLSLPASAQGRFVTFTLTRAADVQYQEAKSTEMKVKAALPRVAVHHKHRHHHHRRRHHHHRHHRIARLMADLAKASVSSGQQHSLLLEESLKAGAPHVEQAELLRTGRTGQILGISMHFDEAPAAAVGVYQRVEQYQIGIKGRDGKLRAFEPPFYWSHNGAYTSDRAGDVGGSFKRPPNSPKSQIKPGEKPVLLLRERIKRLSDGKIVAEVIRRHGFKTIRRAMAVKGGSLKQICVQAGLQGSEVRQEVNTA